MNPKALLSSQDVLEKIDDICRRRFRDENEAMECHNFVIDGLKASDYKRLRSFKGKSSLKTYLYTLTNSLATDFLRGKYGRRRIPVAVQRMGKLAETVYRLLCWRKFSFSEVYDITVIDGRYTGELRTFMKEFEPVRNAPCIENPKFVPADNPSGETVREMPASQPDPLEQLMAHLDGNRRIKAGRVIRKVTDTLSETEQLLVKLVYGSGLAVAAAARTVGMDPPGARKCLKKILNRYREALLSEGIRELSV